MSEQPNPKIEQIVVQKKDLYDATVNVVYDMMCDEKIPLDNFQIEVISAFSTPDRFLTSLKVGNALTHLGAYMEQIEQFHKDAINFMVIVMDNGKIWAVVNGEDVQS